VRVLIAELTSLNTDNVEDDDNDDVAQSSKGLYIALCFIAVAFCHSRKLPGTLLHRGDHFNKHFLVLFRLALCLSIRIL